MWKTYRFLGIFIIFLVGMTLAACGDGNQENESKSDNANESNGNEIGEKSITLGVDNYVSNTSNTYVAKLLLEEIGYDVEVNQTDVGVEYTGLSNGSTDAIVGAWLPTTHGSYWDEYKDDLEKINTVTEKVELGLAVPAYMEDINSIEDLANNTSNVGEKLEWTITGISPGAGEMKMMNNEVMPGYGLNEDWELLESSGAAMSAALSDAIDQKEPIVVTLWTPHWTFNEFDLKILEDPKGTFGEPDDVFSVAGKDFKDQSPAAYKFLEQFSITKENTQKMMVDIKDGMGEEEAAQKFIDNNPDLKDEWLEGFE
ncbi:glycine betaine ABC transporter substrate-binding protein [Lentibacillus salicampi]|uniref:Glycine betaine ABC transporter substrate-binding protein n=1 Tax=Lentibacillus salicampi TaxID=175306 RepID=A0A4Y9ADV1_9BACI|nr:glycine betaine ABC transporter substrate-binding protein [Lentibacillus salicampi]TFJ93277.1 glycine betaine ABC transporter substrate-binding protein [Lentibacillus salicampi]